MLTPRLTNCAECASISGLLDAIDCKITEEAKKMYNNTVFSLELPVNGETLFDLLAYKRILTIKYCNQDYIPEFTVNMIASRVNLLKFK